MVLIAGEMVLVATQPEDTGTTQEEEGGDILGHDTIGAASEVEVLMGTP